MAFLGPPGKPPIAQDGFFDLDLAHVTCCPPFVTKMVEMEKTILEFRQTILDQSQLVLVERRADLDRPETKILLGLQNPPEDPDWPRLVQLGVRVTTIAYEEKNRYGGGFAESDQPLTDEGRKLIDACAEHGLILDLSHAGHRTARCALDLIEKCKLPVLLWSSHGGCARVYDHRRNLPDDVLATIVQRSGVIGISTLTFILHPESNELDSFYDHICFALGRFGSNAVAIGGDGAYCYQSPRKAAEQFAWMQKKLDPRGVFKSRHPDHPSVLNHSYRMHVIGEFLADKLQPEVWQGVMGENFRQFLLRSLPE